MMSVGTFVNKCHPKWTNSVKAQCAQFGSPYELLCDTEGGILTDLVEETGPASRDRLFEMAR